MFEKDNEDESQLTVKEFITANPDDLYFGTDFDHSIEIIDEATGKMGILSIQNLQDILKKYIETIASQDDIEDILNP